MFPKNKHIIKKLNDTQKQQKPFIDYIPDNMRFYGIGGSQGLSGATELARWATDIVLLDVGYNLFDNYTNHFINCYQNKILLWLDHHDNWNKVKWLGNGKLVVRNTPSCAELTKQYSYEHCNLSRVLIIHGNDCDGFLSTASFLLKDQELKLRISNIANKLDTATYIGDKEATMIHRAVFTDRSLRTMKNIIFWTAKAFSQKCSEYSTLIGLEDRYCREVKNNNDIAYATATNRGGYLVIENYSSDRIDFTELCSMAWINNMKGVSLIHSETAKIATFENIDLRELNNARASCKYKIKLKSIDFENVFKEIFTLKRY
jgi:hypothetical protein